MSEHTAGKPMLKLWYFRTQGNRYGISLHRMCPGDMVIVDNGFRSEGIMVCGKRRTRWCPVLVPGECIPDPSRLEVVQKAKRKAKRA